MKTLTALAMASAIAVSPFAVSSASAQNVVEAAQEAGTFETLLAAAEAAGLAETLATTQDITVFAPSDDAFAALPEGTVDDLLMEENADQLTAILQLHVVPSVIMSGDIAEGETEVETLNPDMGLTVNNDGSSITVSAANTATVVQPDIAATMGSST